MQKNDYLIEQCFILGLIATMLYVSFITFALSVVITVMLYVSFWPQKCVYAVLHYKTYF